jgi:hypothetical protein
VAIVVLVVSLALALVSLVLAVVGGKHGSIGPLITMALGLVVAAGQFLNLRAMNRE